MELKSFLRPSKRKIIVTLIIFVIFVPSIAYDNGIRCFRAPCPSTSRGSVVWYLLFSFLFFRQPQTIYAESTIFSLIWPIGLAISYLVACSFLHFAKRGRN